jgi:hypothetical protein
MLTYYIIIPRRGVDIPITKSVGGRIALLTQKSSNLYNMVHIFMVHDVDP